MPTGVELIAAERARQPTLGFDAAHDDGEHPNALAMAAIAYLQAAGYIGGCEAEKIPVDLPRMQKSPPEEWPWKDRWDPSATRLRNLQKAGALIAAALDQEIRKNPPPAAPEPEPQKMAGRPKPLDPRD